MSLRLAALSLLLRLFEKPRLAAAQDLTGLRAGFEAIAAASFPSPPGVSYADEWLGRIAAVRARPPGAGGALILYLHGGAFILGSPRTHRHLAAALAAAAGAEAAIPAYRLAPEHPHPAALEDALAAWRALLDRGADPARTAFAGDSAGGGLALALAAAARAEGLPDPACVVAFSPWVDMTLSGASWRTNAEADCMLPATRAPEVVGWRMNGADLRDPFASPLFARWDRPPPPALIFASRTEVLADDAIAMAAALKAAGGEAEIAWAPDAPHAWPIFTGLAPEADEALAEAGAYVARRTGVAP
ncbi:MAG: alpha/beta hydrolase [Rhodobacteraceae bacterium]|nr:MAG: alpha/beta hydrolase [Paracoccaceae bacterium]